MRSTGIKATDGGLKGSFMRLQDNHDLDKQYLNLVLIIAITLCAGLEF